MEIVKEKIRKLQKELNNISEQRDKLNSAEKIAKRKLFFLQERKEVNYVPGDIVVATFELRDRKTTTKLGVLTLNEKCVYLPQWHLTELNGDGSISRRKHFLGSFASKSINNLVKDHRPATKKDLPTYDTNKIIFNKSRNIYQYRSKIIANIDCTD